MRNLKVRAVMTFARLFGVPIAIHQTFFIKSAKVKMSSSSHLPTTAPTL